MFSDGRRIAADLYLPEAAPGGRKPPVVVACSGYLGLKEIHPTRFARALVPRGFACLAFDYGGWGGSDGRRGLVKPQDQVEDLRGVIAAMQSVDVVDAEQLGLIGWAMGGSVAIAAAADDDRVRAVVAANPFGDGERALRSMHDDDSWDRLLALVAEDRSRRAHGAPSELVDAFRISPLDDVTRRYVGERLETIPGFETQVLAESADHWLRFRPERHVDRLAPTALLLVHGSNNGFHRPEESEALYARATEPKELVLLDDAGHVEWMVDDHPLFRRVVDLVIDFLRRHGVGHQR